MLYLSCYKIAVKDGSSQHDPNLSKQNFSFHFSSYFNSVIDRIIASYAFHMASSY